MSHDVSVQYDSSNGAYRNRVESLIGQYHGKVRDSSTYPESEKLSWWQRRWGWRSTIIKSKRGGKSTTAHIEFPTWADASRFRQAAGRIDWLHVCNW